MKRDLKGWGPFAHHLLPDERKARIRCLRALAVTYLGPRGAEVNRMLRQAEDDPTMLDGLRDLLTAMPEADLRRIWTAYVAVEVS